MIADDVRFYSPIPRNMNPPADVLVRLIRLAWASIFDIEAVRFSKRLVCVFDLPADFGKRGFGHDYTAAWWKDFGSTY